ncbi:MAG: MFS transporter [candidate division KSB1 bacterium]|nr:MFS transporter [candidate division KSB1 bacterium]MDZ7318582.1 MFS transporter [candidate division KSB1 bacterium]MDZ7339718.1 MFS transporter [candidate division KSB1 bacterium]
MIATGFGIARTVRALRLSIYDGIFANIYINLTGSVFLPAFALALGASSLQIGILASIPLFANIAQLGGTYLVEKYNRRKKVAVRSAFAARALWLPIVVLSVLLASRSPWLVLQFAILLIAISSVLGAVSGVAWLSWMSFIVPGDIRGRYFGLRNAILGAANIAFTLLAGRFLDWFRQQQPNGSQLHAFELLFAFALGCGLLSVRILARQPEPPSAPQADVNFRAIYRAPLKQKHYRLLLRFAALWSFAVNMAAPFFIVYMLKVLDLSYTMIALLTVTTAAADLLGMWLWGQISDRIGNRPVVWLSAWMITFLPMLWLFTTKTSSYLLVLLPLLQLSAGFFWAAYNLCSVNLVLGMASKTSNSAYFAYWASVNGVAAGLGALSGGVLAKYLHHLAIDFSFSAAMEFKTIFLISGLLRLVSLFMLRRVQEPQRAAGNLQSGWLNWWPLKKNRQPRATGGIVLPNRAVDRGIPAYWPLWRLRFNRQ